MSDSINQGQGLGESAGIPLGTPASEWSSSTLAALKAPGQSNTTDLRGQNTMGEFKDAPAAGDLTAPTAQTSGFTPVTGIAGLGSSSSTTPQFAAPGASDLTAPTAQTAGFAPAVTGSGLGSSPNVPAPGTSGHSEGLTTDQKLAAASGFTGGLGGLGSSPLVPKPGTSGHSEGMTMAEFQAKKAAEAAAVPSTGAGPAGERSASTVISQLGNLSLENDKPQVAATDAGEPKGPFGRKYSGLKMGSGSPPATNQNLMATSGLDAESLKGLSGREQAARQLGGGLGIGQGAAGAGPAGLRDQVAAPGVASAAHGVAGTSGPVSPEAVGMGGLAAPTFARSVTDDLMTPGKELPGGWGPVAPVPPPGTSSHAPTSIYEDVSSALNSVGKAAFTALPTGVVETISGHKADGTPIEKNQGLRAGEGSPVQNRRGSAVAFFENAKQQITHLVHDAGEAISPNRRESQPHPLDKFVAPVPDRQRRASTMSNTSASGEGILGQAKDLIGGILGSGAAALGPHPPSRATGVTSATSLPSDEVVGAKPGDHSAGVGALPGTIDETGVAVLPDVRANPDPLSTSANAGQDLSPGSKGVESNTLPDERADVSTSSGAHPVVAASPPPAHSSVPEPHLATTSSDAHAPLAAPASPPPAGSTVPEPSAAGIVGSSVDTTGLNSANDSPALADTPAIESSSAGIVGSSSETTGLNSSTGSQSLAKSSANPAVFHSGSTPDEATAPVTESSKDDTLAKFGLGAAIAGGGVAAAGGVAALRSESSATPPANDRSDSSASVMAIRHGTEGAKNHELPAAAYAAESDLPSLTEGEKLSTGHSNDVSGAKSLTPGNEHEGVGHPSTRDQPGNTREPGTYSGLKIASGSADDKTSPSEGITSVAPGSEAAPDAHPATKDFPHDTTKVSHEKPSVVNAAPPATPPKDKVAASPVSTSKPTSAVSPTSTTTGNTSSGAASGHRRTSSNSSGKKVGFMDKLKGEIKVISGKISKDEAKIQEGERLKHEGH